MSAPDLPAAGSKAADSPPPGSKAGPPSIDQTAQALADLVPALLEISRELSVDGALRRVVGVARRTVGARYAALGVPDGEGGFEAFLTVGVDAATWDAIGELPRSHGLLGSLVDTGESYRTDDIATDPRFGWWPPGHPQMGAFAGVPIKGPEGLLGIIYVADKPDGGGFSDEDLRLLETLAAHAAVVVRNAQLYERSRELALVEERTRLARELHDAVSQRLFSLSLTADAAEMLVDRDAGKAREQIGAIKQLVREATAEMRAMLHELRPPDLDADGLVGTIRKRAALVERVHGVPVGVRVRGERRLPDAVEAEILRILEEALANAVRHAKASRIELEVDLRGRWVRARVVDDGVGFDPYSRKGRHRLGLTTMRERATALGGSFEIISERGKGTTVALEVGCD